MAALKVGFVGSGGMARAHAPGIAKMKNVKIVGFSDPVLDRAEVIAAEYDAQAFAKPEDMMDALKPDAVYMMLPPFAHGPEFAAIERKIPFLVEKPINLYLKQANEIAAAVEKAGLITCAGYMNRYRKGIQKAKKLLEKDPAVLVTGGWIGGKPSVNPDAPISVWWVQKKLSGGQFIEQVTHTVDLVRFLCGDAVEVSAFAATGFNTGIPTYDIEDAMAVTVKFAGGAVANLNSCCASGAMGGVDLNVYAGKIGFKFTGWEHTAQVYRPGKDPETWPGEGDIFAIEDAAFLKAVRTGDPSGIMSTYSDAVKTLAISIAADESVKKGKVVKV
jgi:predicted dehydrogenase